MLTKATPEVKKLIEEIEYCRANSEFPKLVDLSMQLYDMAQEKGSQELKNLASCLVGDACALNQDFSYGIYMLTSGINGVLKSGETEIACRCLNEIGVILHSQGHYIASEEAFVKAITVARRENHFIYEAMACSNFASLCIEMDDFEHAQNYYTRAIECFTKLEDTKTRYQYIVGILSYVVILYVKTDEDIKANAMYREMEAYIEDYHLDATGFVFVICRLIFKHYIGDEIAEARYKEEALAQFYNSEKYLINYDECKRLFDYLLETRDYEKLEACLAHFTSISVCEDLVNQFIHVQELYMKMYDETGEREKLLEASYKYVNLLSKKTEEAKKSFAITVKQQIELRDAHRSTIMDVTEGDIDELTGLAGRKRLTLVAEELFSHAKDEGKSFGVEIVAIDDYKDLVQIMGVECLENIVVEAAERLKKLVSDRIYIARYEEGEFIIFFYDMTDSQILEIAAKIHEQSIQIARNYDAGKISVSQGLINAVPISYNRSWDFLSAADEALNTVQTQCKGNCRLVHNDFELREEYVRMF